MDVTRLDQLLNSGKAKHGSLCRRGHSWKGAQKSVRHTASGKCIECQKHEIAERKKSYVKRKSLYEQIMAIDVANMARHIELSASSPSGLRWKDPLSTRCKPGDVAGSEQVPGRWVVSYKGYSYAATHLILLLSGRQPMPGDTGVVLLSGNASMYDPKNIRWGSKNSGPRIEARKARDAHVAAVVNEYKIDVTAVPVGRELRPLCKEGHRWNGVPLSLFANGVCVECRKVYIRKRKDSQREQRGDFDDTLERLQAIDISDLKLTLKIDPSSPSGLTWLVSRGRVKAGSKAGSIHGGSRDRRYMVFYRGLYYQASHLILIMSGKWPVRGQVATRINPSGSWADPENLCWDRHGASLSSSALARYEAWLSRTLGDLGIDQGDVPQGCEIRPLCGKGHKWNGHDVSLYRGSRCIECEKERKRTASYLEARAGWLARNRERLNESAKRRQREKMSDPSFRELKKLRSRTSQAKIRAERGRQSRAKGLEQLQLPPGVHLDRISAKICRDLIAEGYPLEADVLLPIATGERYQIEKELWVLRKALEDCGKTPTVAQLVDQEQKRYWAENPEQRQRAIRENRRLYHLWKHKTDPEYRAYHRQKSKRRKALLKQSIGVHIKGRQIRNRFAEFDHACAYCGATGEDLHIEHVVPISRGGTHTLGNIVPACKACNFSKAASDVETWYRRQQFFRESRWRKIKQVLGWDKSSTGQLSLI